MDIAVLAAQKWVNTTYAGRPGYVACPESGVTGWTTMGSLTRGLQLELKVGVDGSFGPGTASAMTSFGLVTAATSNKNILTIVQCAMYAKGYDGGGADGVWGPRTVDGIAKLKSNMGLTTMTPTIDTKMMRSLLNMDAYVIIWDGDPTVREVQRWMNATFLERKDFPIIPCDGLFSRGVQKGLVYALQYSLGVADGTADGVFGPSTREQLRTRGAVGLGSADSGSRHLVRLFKAGLIFNRYVNVDWDSATFTTATAAVTKSFQSFCHLPVTGGGGYATWCSLLSSTGDPQRPASGADCMTPLTQTLINTLKSNSVEIIGRYIAGGVNKRMTKTEASLILQNGLRFFPIYQEINNAPQYFTNATGIQQGNSAIQNARDLGVPEGTVLYFCCDWDPTSDEIDFIVLPFFRGISNAMVAADNPYQIGVYGTRNLCTRIAASGIGVASFVAGMSSGWSGNLGFPLPGNWAFDQIAGVTLSPGTTGQLAIDRNVVSGRDPGVSALEVPIDPVANYFDWLVDLEGRANEWRATGRARDPAQSAQWLTAEYIRNMEPRYRAGDFNVLCGDIDGGFVEFADVPEAPPVTDPLLYRAGDLAHFGAVMRGCFKQPLPKHRVEPGLHDFGGWAGDLITLAAQAYLLLTDRSEAAGYQRATALLGQDQATSSFSVQDLIADVDAEVAYWLTWADPTLTVGKALLPFYRDATAGAQKFRAMVDLRFGSTETLERSAQIALEAGGDTPYATWRAALWATKVQDLTAGFGIAVQLYPGFFKGVARAFSDRILTLARY